MSEVITLRAEPEYTQVLDSVRGDMSRGQAVYKMLRYMARQDQGWLAWFIRESLE